jgi:hypothetical protein
MRIAPARRLAPALLALALAPACATRQTVSFHCVPQDAVVYVDGRRLEEVPAELRLRAGEPHTIFFKGGRYRPQMVVLRSDEQDGEPRLSPADICSETVFVEMAPEVEMVVDPEDEGGAPAAP